MFDKVVIVSKSSLFCAGVELFLQPLLEKHEARAEKQVVSKALEFQVALQNAMLTEGKVLVLVDSHLFAMPWVKYIFGWAAGRITGVLLHDDVANKAFTEKAAALGFSGCLQKTATPKQFEQMIDMVSEGKKVWGIEGSESPSEQKRCNLWDIFTDRETDVARCIASGLLNKQIGHELGISEDTVKSHVSRILQKTNLDNRTQFVVALQGGATPYRPAAASMRG